MLKKRDRETRDTHFMFSDFFFKSCSFWDYLETHCSAGQATDDNMAHAHCVLDIYGYRRKLPVFLNYNNGCWILDVRFESFFPISESSLNTSKHSCALHEWPGREWGIICRSLTTYSRFRSRAIPCISCGWPSGTDIGFSCTSLLLCQYHSNNAPFSPSAKWDLTEVKRAKAVYLETKKYPFTYRVLLDGKVLSHCLGPIWKWNISVYNNKCSSFNEKCIVVLGWFVSPVQHLEKVNILWHQTHTHTHKHHSQPQDNILRQCF